jgi:hypothetical protein
MAEREVTRSRKDASGDITALCNPGEAWSPRLKAAAIADIESKTHSYYVLVGGRRVGVIVVSEKTGKYLRTSPDSTTRNNLDDLPDC